MQRTRASKPLSCAECRRLKVKCDLTFPCGNCVKRGLASICPDGELVNGTRGQRVLAGTEDLHKRIDALETALKQATSSLHSLLADTHGVQSSANLRTTSTSPSSPSLPDARTSAGQTATHRLSSYGHLILDLEDDPGVTRYYGAASSVYLTVWTKRVSSRRADDTSSSSRPPALFDIPTPVSFTNLNGPTASIGEIMVQYLPLESVGQELADVYFQTFGWFTNIVPQTTWDEKYFQHVYRDAFPPKPQRLAVLFLVFALAALMDFSRPQSDETAHKYVQAARLSLAHDFLPSVTIVQIVFLYATVLMNGRNNAASGEIGWPFLRAGMAIAESIGLHRDASQWDLDERDATERRIVFWEIHGYDVLQSIALGRGQCIADCSIDCALPDDGDETVYYCKTYMLTRIWSRINERQIRVQPSTYAEVYDIDQAINEFERSLPGHLSGSMPPSLLDLTDPVRRRLAFRRNMISIYVVEARMALHRGWFVQALKEYPHEPLQSPQAQSVLSCLESCRTLIVLVRNMLAIHDQYILRRWHFFFHLFTACACLAACGIRAPSSSLAKAVVAELEHGIDLFRTAQRDETVQLERLRDQAVEAVHAGNTGAPATQMEDLDLLSARKTLRRSESGATRTELSQSVVPAPDNVYQYQSNGPLGFDSAISLPVSGGFDMNAFLEEMGLV